MTHDENSRFTTTRWSVILHAQGDNSQLAAASMEEFCSAYWYPLYAYVRRTGVNPVNAQDLTQGFFAAFLERDWMQGVDRERGRFRSFLLASIKHYMANQWKKEKAQKRGGNFLFLSTDFRDAEGRYTDEPVNELTPDRLFDRAWALTLLRAVLEELRSSYETQGKCDLFDALKDRLVAKSGNTPYTKIAEQLDMNEAAVKVAVHRLRKRYRELIRERVEQTVSEVSEVDAELQALLASLSY